MILKEEFEKTFKEGFRLGVRLTRSKVLLAQAGDARKLGDVVMATFYADCAKQWTDLAHNSGRKFCPEGAKDPEQPAFDFGDSEKIIDSEPELNVRKAG
jgi:hypothetical protein